MLDFESFVRCVQPMKPAKTKDEKKLADIMKSPAYLAEEKIDGCHYMMFGHRFFSIENVEKTANFPYLSNFFKSLNWANLILDGEIHYPGKTSQYATHVTGAGKDKALVFQEVNGPVHYTIWGILRHPDGRWLHNIPFTRHRSWLEAFYRECIDKTVLREHIHLTGICADEDKNSYYENILARGGEGIILKKRDSVYHFGKKPAWQWVKVKKNDTADLFIMSFVQANPLYKGANIEGWPYWDVIDGISRPVTKDHALGWIGSLRLGAYVDGKETFICDAGGLTDNWKKDISNNKEKYLGRVVKIEFMEKTTKGVPRHPSFECFHEGKKKEECTWVFE